MKTCLIADDAPIICKVAARILETHDYASEAVDAPERLRAALAKAMPDLLIVADRLGNAEGLKLVEEVRAMPCGAMPTILLCTSETGFALRSKLRRSGANGALLKPFTRETLETQLGRLGLTRALAA